jgi:hypothetical protein
MIKFKISSEKVGFITYDAGKQPQLVSQWLAAQVASAKD